jgi:FlaA1/EpsC-like NDP-sugar epimerase
MMIVFPDEDSPNLLVKSTVIIRMFPATVICTFFIAIGALRAPHRQHQRFSGPSCMLPAVTDDNVIVVGAGNAAQAAVSARERGAEREMPGFFAGVEPAPHGLFMAELLIAQSHATARRGARA